MLAMREIIVLGAVLGQLVFCLGIDLESVEEGPCFDKPPKSAFYDTSAFSNSSIKWHHHMWNKYYLYRVAVDVTRKDYPEISESDLETSCPRFSAQEQGTIAVFGFNGKKRIYEVGVGDYPDSFRWKASGNDDWDAETWVTKADPDTNYIVFYTCYATNQRAFLVASKLPTLSPEDKSDIADHLESLGFSQDYYYEHDVAACTRDEYLPPKPKPSKGYVYSRPSVPFYYRNVYFKK